MEKELLYKILVINMKVNGTKINKMEKEKLQCQQKRYL